ncbi:chymotrypsin inhibitor-like [Pseudomyrmex gracilis]|uniref:chymotrypsin inhibitor-like n=1 Tax=Pseudomyrmex gracilis TaxID=219809 RepID=UPI00099549D0|nr:chymotrypsin inhibitor-like [Pseudomyrmex gracilis]
MSRAVFVVLLVIGVLISTTIAQPTAQSCPENQEWTTCGSACPPSCNSDPHRACTLQCIIGCQCKSGLLLNSQGNCVAAQDC